MTDPVPVSPEPDWSVRDPDERHDPRCPRSEAGGRLPVPCLCPDIAARVFKADARRSREIRHG